MQPVQHDPLQDNAQLKSAELITEVLVPEGKAAQQACDNSNAGHERLRLLIVHSPFETPGKQEANNANDCNRQHGTNHQVANRLHTSSQTQLFITIS
jgi:hypothetical protein